MSKDTHHDVCKREKELAERMTKSTQLQAITRIRCLCQSTCTRSPTTSHQPCDISDNIYWQKDLGILWQISWLRLAKKANWTLGVGNARKEITKVNGTLGHEQANLMLFIVDIPSSSLPVTCMKFLLLVSEGDGFCMILTLKGTGDIE